MYEKDPGPFRLQFCLTILHMQPLHKDFFSGTFYIRILLEKGLKIMLQKSQILKNKVKRLLLWALLERASFQQIPFHFINAQVILVPSC